MLGILSKLTWNSLGYCIEGRRLIPRKVDDFLFAIDPLPPKVGTLAGPLQGTLPGRACPARPAPAELRENSALQQTCPEDLQCYQATGVQYHEHDRGGRCYGRDIASVRGLRETLQNTMSTMSCLRRLLSGVLQSWLAKS